MWTDLGLALPQLLALLFLAIIAAFIAELIVGNAPMLGFIGAIIFALLGAWLFILLPWFQFPLEPKLEDVPVIRAVIGGILTTSLFAFVRKKRRA